MKDIFGEGGILAGFHERFELRKEQILMSDFILESLCDRQNGLIEAGTGVGKTLAYIIPAMCYCLDNGKKLAISTETKALQKQLVDKDLPLARRVVEKYLGRSFSYSLCLGSSNYPCRRRFEVLLSKGNFQKSDAGLVEDIRGRFAAGKIFTRFDVRVPSRLWDEVSRDGETCSGYNCPFFTKCIFQLARREWARSDLLVLNHYLFFADVAAGKTYLPAVDNIVFDEAHSIEEIAADQLGFSVSRGDIDELIGRFYKKNRRNTIVQAVPDAAIRKKAVSTITAISKEMDAFFEDMRGFFPPDKNSVRLREPLKKGPAFVNALKKLHGIAVEMEEAFEDDTMQLEYEIARNRLYTCIQNLGSAVYHESDEYVYWMEKSEDALLGDITVIGQPVDVAERLQRDIFDAYESAFFVSATLAVGGDFSYMARRLGATRYKTLYLQSPFDYKNQVVLMIAKDADRPDGASFAEKSAAISAKIIEHLKGGCLLLFTSYRMMDDVKDRLAPLIGYSVYSQGDFPAAEAMDRYLQHDDAVLMGTHSFWQGIDLPGDLLRGVIIMRLPFSVPDRPPVEARMERLEAQGVNSFYGYQVPSAVIRFRQGFGRLIRGKNDRGIVAVLDSRIVTKSYGRVFLQSLPECRRVYSFEELQAAYPSS